MTYFKVRNLDIKGKTRRKSLSILHVVRKQQSPNDRQLVNEKSSIHPESEENGS